MTTIPEPRERLELLQTIVTKIYDANKGLISSDEPELGNLIADVYKLMPKLVRAQNRLKREVAKLGPRKEKK